MNKPKNVNDVYMSDAPSKELTENNSDTQGILTQEIALPLAEAKQVLGELK